MIKFVQFAFALMLAGLLPALGGAEAQPILPQEPCHAALASLAGRWNAAGLPTPPAGPLGGIQAKGGVVRLANGRSTSLANFQSMTIVLHAAAAACQASEGGVATEKVALLRDRLDKMGH